MSPAGMAARSCPTTEDVTLLGTIEYTPAAASVARPKLPMLANTSVQLRSRRYRKYSAPHIPTRSGPRIAPLDANTTTAAMPSMKLALIDMLDSKRLWFSASANSPPSSTSGTGSGSGVVNARTTTIASATKPRLMQYAVNARVVLGLSFTEFRARTDRAEPR